MIAFFEVMTYELRSGRPQCPSPNMIIRSRQDSLIVRTKPFRVGVQIWRLGGIVGLRDLSQSGEP